jgi:hypothetical protein
MPQSLENTKDHKENYAPINESVERIAKLVVDAAYSVHVKLEPGFLEKVYEICFFNVPRLKDGIRRFVI